MPRRREPLPLLRHASPDGGARGGRGLRRREYDPDLPQRADVPAYRRAGGRRPDRVPLGLRALQGSRSAGLRRPQGDPGPRGRRASRREHGHRRPAQRRLRSQRPPLRGLRARRRPQRARPAGRGARGHLLGPGRVLPSVRIHFFRRLPGRRRRDHLGHGSDDPLLTGLRRRRHDSFPLRGRGNRVRLLLLAARRLMGRLGRHGRERDVAPGPHPRRRPLRRLARGRLASQQERRRRPPDHRLLRKCDRVLHGDQDRQLRFLEPADHRRLHHHRPRAQPRLDAV